MQILYNVKKCSKKRVLAVTCIKKNILHTGLTKKMDCFWQLITFEMVNGKKSTDMSKVSELCLEKV